MEESPAMTEIRLGTMGFSYSDWAGVFYPQGTKPGDYLSHYARHFDTVELDTTFHATPPIARVQRWADVTPDDFRFCVKTPKSITHEGALDLRIKPMHEFLDVMRAFEKKLAVVLIQLSPSCGIDQFEPLERLFKSLPTDIRFAIEFRSASWGQQRTLDLLREHRVALVAAEYLTRPSRIHLTTDLLYLRLIGEHERFEELNHEQIDVEPNLHWWKAELDRVMRIPSSPPEGQASARAALPSGGRGSLRAAGDNPSADTPQLHQIWGFFNNDYSGYSIATCRRFMHLLGLEVREDQDLAQQGKLFG